MTPDTAPPEMASGIVMFAFGVLFCVFVFVIIEFELVGTPVMRWLRSLDTDERPLRSARTVVVARCAVCRKGIVTLEPRRICSRCRVTVCEECKKDITKNICPVYGCGGKV